MATQITIRPNKLIYSSTSTSLWTRAWDNDLSTMAMASDPPTSSGRRTYCVTLDVSSVPQNAVITKYRVRFLRKNSDASGGVVELALGTATSDTYYEGGTSDVRTVVTSETSLSNPYYSGSNPQEITSSWYTLTEPEQQSFIAGTYKTLYIYISKATLTIYEMYVDIEYKIPATSKIYVGGSQVSAAYIGSTKASAVYIGNTKIL